MDCTIILPNLCAHQLKFFAWCEDIEFENTVQKNLKEFKGKYMASNLTKSKFKLALECPTKLYYVDKPEYANQQTEDSFLKALAEGGYQVDALAIIFLMV